MSASRDDLLARLSLAGREFSNAAVMFHTAAAARMGLNATEAKVLDLLQRDGPTSPGDLARRTGLAPASVTGLLHRLEAKGFARRRPDPSDGRRLVVEIDYATIARHAGTVYHDLATRLGALYADFSDDDLAVVLDWVEKVTAAQRAATAQITDATT
jgi:DNA-binding MarR family transcriptional regulator